MGISRPLLGGNWKMHGDLASCVELTENLIASVWNEGVLEKVDVASTSPLRMRPRRSHPSNSYLLSSMDVTR